MGTNQFKDHQIFDFHSLKVLVILSFLTKKEWKKLFLFIHFQDLVKSYFG